MNLWYPLAKKIVLVSAGPYVAGPWRGVLHSTEGTTAAGAVASYRKTGDCPHFTVAWEAGALVVLQHIAIDRAVSAMRNLTGGVETNRLHCIQIEVVGFAAHAATWPTPLLDGLRTLMEWVEAQTGIKPHSPVFKPYPASYGANNGVRMTADQWREFDGWCGHMHVPENLHGDPGDLDINYLLQRAPLPPKEVAPMFDPPLAMEPWAAAWKDERGAVLAAISSDGDVYAFGVAWVGNVSGRSWWGDRRAAQIGPRPDGAAGYRVTATTGEFYDMPYDVP